MISSVLYDVVGVVTKSRGNCFCAWLLERVFAAICKDFILKCHYKNLSTERQKDLYLVDI